MKIRTLPALAALALAATLGVAGCSSTDEAGATTSTSPAPVAIPKAGINAATVVLVHGAFADSGSWDETIKALQAAGYRTVAFANPLRGVANDSAELASLVDTIKGPVVLVGHSYAGMVISDVAARDHDVTGLVYVAAFIPRVGESVNSLNSMYPGSQLIPDNLMTSPAPGGLTDVYLKQDTYHTVYAGGLTDEAAKVAAATQRPVAAEALAEKATTEAPATTRKWMVVATEDNAVPTEVQRFMARRANATTTEVASGHDVPAAQPTAVAKVVAEAAG